MFDIDEFKLDICNSMSAMRIQQPLKTILLKFQINMLLRKQKFQEGFKNPILMRIMAISRPEYKANKSKNPSDIVKFK